MKSLCGSLAFTLFLSLVTASWALPASTQTPTLTQPASGQTIGTSASLIFTLPEAAKSGSLIVIFSNGGTPTVLTLSDVQGTANTEHTVPLDVTDPTRFGASFIVSASGPAITDGTYSVTLSYQNTLGAPAASATSTGVVVDTSAGTPTLSAPVRFGVSTSPINVDFTLPEPAKAGTVMLTFVDFNATNHSFVLASSFETTGRHTFSFNPANPAASPEIVSGAALDDGPYDIVDLSYRDLAGNFGDAQFSGDASGPGFTIKTVTQTPTLTKPLASVLSPNPVAVDFTLPEAALNDSVQLIFDDGTTSRTLTLASSVAGRQTFSFDPAAPSDPAIATAASIPDGTYKVTLRYQDALGNAAATAAHTGVVVDATAPQISVPAATRRVFAGPLADYTSLAQVVDAHPGSVSQAPSIGDAVSAGVQTITLTAMDLAGNDASTSFDLDVRPLAPISVKVAAAGVLGDPAPDHGMLGTDGPPDDAKLASFGVPAVDDAGNVSYIATWTSVSKGKGSGLFLNNKCLGIVGGDASAIAPAASWKSFSDPVGEAGKVACIAKLSTGASAVVANFTGTALEKIALTGTAAGAGDANFKSFKAIAWRGGALGFQAQLTGGTGLDKVTAENDMGEWIRESGNDLHLIYRDGFNLSPIVVGSFVAFRPGLGSPGQSRGWLSHPNGTGVLLTLSTSTGESKALVFGGYGGATFLARTGETDTNFAPPLAGTSFASFRFPALNDALQYAFYATMNLKTGSVTKADAGAIFAGSANFSGPLGPKAIVARVGSDAPTAGATFSQIKDPVLAQDGGLAFPATLKANTLVKGLATKTLWWAPAAGGSLAPLAQGGKPPVEITSTGTSLAQWKSFPSLAIAANRGPVFIATLMPGKGGVIPATATGVWATDFTGATRLLFRTGIPDAILHGKILKSFTLLNATVGSVGVTRSFNDIGDVVWRATFTDKSTAIIRTTVP